jgi:hypothetical protein
LAPPATPRLADAAAADAAANLTLYLADPAARQTAAPLYAAIGQS